MSKVRNGFIRNLQYLCLVSVIALGLLTIVGTGGGGGGGGTTPTTTPPPTTQPVPEQDVRNVSAWVVVNSIWTIHNLYIAGTPGGAKDIPDADCPNGGTVSITGTASVSGGMELRDLTYTFDNCVCAEQDGTVTFVNGSCRQNGSWKLDEYQQLAYSGTSTMYMRSLNVGGQEYDRDYVDCEFSISEQMWYGDWSYSGFWCGEEIAW